MNEWQRGAYRISTDKHLIDVSAQNLALPSYHSQIDGCCAALYRLTKHQVYE